MASLCSLGFASIVMIILLALKFSSAECDQGIESQKNVFLQSDSKFVLGRKMLQKLDGNPVYTQGRSKPADVDNSFPQVQTENNHVKSQQHPQKSILKHDESTTKKHDESKEAMLEAADEVANLMRKDYRGMARRKPPINNHEPKD